MASRADKSPNAFRTIGEVADFIGVPQHVLRFWESKFGQINPMKRGGGRRYYRPEDVEIIEAIRMLLHDDGYTIKGAQKYLKEQGISQVVDNLNNNSKIENPPRSSFGSSDNNSDYEMQIHGLIQTNTQQQKEGAVVTLKDLRTRLEKIRRNLAGPDN